MPGKGIPDPFDFVKYAQAITHLVGNKGGK
jgi:hypothetical protein